MPQLTKEVQVSTPRNSRQFFEFDYSNVPEKYRASQYPDDELILYKGAVKGFHRNGFTSLALAQNRLEHLLEEKEAIELGNLDRIHDIVNRHTSYHYMTPFLSATLNPEEAQVFAPTDVLCKYLARMRGEPEKTIYRLKVKANRCIKDADNTGCTGASGEFLILGLIYPDEITAVKIKNDDKDSELLTYDKGIGCQVIKRHPDRGSTNTEVKDPKNWKVMG